MSTSGLVDPVKVIGGQSGHGAVLKKAFTGVLCIMSLLMMMWSPQLTTGSTGRRLSSYGREQTMQNYSVHFLALMEFVMRAGGRAISSCKRALPTILSRDPDGSASTMVCSMSLEVFQPLIGLTNECLRTRNRTNSTILTPEDAAEWLNNVTQLNETLAICCGRNWTFDTGVVRSRNESIGKALLHAPDCLFNSSFTEMVWQLHDSLQMTSCNHTQTLLLWPSNLANKLHNGIVPESVNQQLTNLQWLITNLRHNGNQKLTEIKRSSLSVYALESSLSETTGVKFNWTEGLGTRFILCNSILATGRLGGTDCLPVCSSVCERTKRLLQSLAHFVNVTKVPFLHVLEEATSLCGVSSENSSEGCIVPDEHTALGYSVSNHTRSSAIVNKSLSLVGGFCFHVGCKSYLLATTKKSHWVNRQQNKLLDIHTDVIQAFPQSFLPFNNSLWPCGEACRSPGLTYDEENLSALFIGTCSLVTVLTTVIVVVVFYFNVRELSRNFIYRILVCFAATSGLEHVFYLSSLFGYKQLICYSDGVLVREQPGDKPMCGFVAWFAHFFSLISTGYFMLLMYAWQELARDIDQPGFGLDSQENSWWLKYHRDVLSAGVVSLPALGLMVGAMVQHRYEGIAEIGTCHLEARYGGTTYYYTSYQLLVLVPSLFFLQKGIHYLKKHTKNTKHTGKIRRVNTRLGVLVPSDNSESMKALRELTGRLKLYLVLVVMCLTIQVWYGLFIFIESSDSAFDTVSVRHQTCVMTSCTPKNCSRPPEYDIELAMVVWFAIAVVIVLLSSWAIHRRLLQNVPLIRAVVKGRKPTWTSSMQTMSLQSS